MCFQCIYMCVAWSKTLFGNAKTEFKMKDIQIVVGEKSVAALVGASMKISKVMKIKDQTIEYTTEEQ